MAEAVCMLARLLRAMAAGLALALTRCIPNKALGSYRARKQSLIGLGPEQAGNDIFGEEIAVMSEHFLVVGVARDLYLESARVGYLGDGLRCGRARKFIGQLLGQKDGILLFGLCAGMSIIAENGAREIAYGVPQTYRVARLDTDAAVLYADRKCVARKRKLRLGPVACYGDNEGLLALSDLGRRYDGGLSARHDANDLGKCRSSLKGVARISLISCCYDKAQERLLLVYQIVLH